MDETIGAKGGRNDRRRTMIIARRQKEKLKRLEQDVKKKQPLVFLGALPIIITGTTLKVFYDTISVKNKKDSTWEIKEDDLLFPTKVEKNEKKINKQTDELVISKEKDQLVESKEENIIKQRDEKKEIIFLEPIEKKIPPKSEEKKSIENKQIANNISNENKKVETTTNNILVEKKVSLKQKDNEELENKEENFVVKNNPIKKEKDKIFSPVFVEKQTNIIMPTVSFLPSAYEVKKIKNKKILEEYEKELKNLRYEFRNLFIEYHKLDSFEEKTNSKEEEEKVFDKLNEIIRKIEILKEKMIVEDYTVYDDQTVYDLIHEYIKEFNDKKIIEDIEDSELYILLSEKIAEIDSKKDSLRERINVKQDKFNHQNESLADLKGKYQDFEKFDQELLKFQIEQEQILKEIKEKIENAVSIQERVEIQTRVLNNESRRLLALLSLSMFFPRKKSTKALLSSAALYLYFANTILKPEKVERKYKVIQVKDYEKSINNEFDSIEKTADLFNKINKKLDKTIEEVKNNLSGFVGDDKEYRELLTNFEKIRANLHEKEYELEKIKEENQKLWKENKEKVLTKGEYPV